MENIAKDTKNENLDEVVDRVIAIREKHDAEMKALNELKEAVDKLKKKSN